MRKTLLSTYLFLAFSTHSSLAAQLTSEDAVKLFLGIGSGSGVTAQSVEAQGSDVTVRNLSLPLGDAASTKQTHLKIRELRFLKVEAEETTARFEALSGSDIVLVGSETLAARSLASGPLKAKDLGTTAFSVEGELQISVADIIAKAGRSTMRVGGYSLTFRGDPAGRFSQAAKVRDLRTDDTGKALASEGLQLQLSYEGDAITREVKGTVEVRQAQFGSLTGEFQLVETEPAVDRLALVFGQNIFASGAKVKSASLTFAPSEQVRMMLMVLPTSEKESLVANIMPAISRAVAMPKDEEKDVADKLRGFLMLPDSLRVSMSPSEPVKLDLIGRPSSDLGSNSRSTWDQLGLRIATSP